MVLDNMWHDVGQYQMAVGWDIIGGVRWMPLVWQGPTCMSYCHEKCRQVAEHEIDNYLFMWSESNGKLTRRRSAQGENDRGSE